MTSTLLSRASAGLALVAALGASTSVLAQAKAAAAPAAGTQLSVSGPVLPGVCILNSDRVATQSTVGQYVINRLRTMDQQIRTELTPEQTSLSTAAQAFQSQRASLTQDQLQQQGSALQQRYEKLNQTAQIRARELELTQQKAIQRINTEMAPVIQQVYGQRNCGLLLDRAAIVVANPQMEITDGVIAGLNSRITQFAFERERLPAQAAPAGAAARPAATPATPPKRK